MKCYLNCTSCKSPVWGWFGAWYYPRTCGKGMTTVPGSSVCPSWHPKTYTQLELKL